MSDEAHSDDYADDDDVPCARHPKRLTALRCSNCDTPICPDCAVAAAVGLKCPDCGKLPRSARAAVPTSALARAIAAGIVLGALGGVVFLVFQAQVGFLTIIAGFLIGIGVGEGVTRASGGFRDATIAMIARFSAGLGILIPYVPFIIANPAVLGRSGMLWTLIAAAIAAYSAGTRVSR